MHFWLSLPRWSDQTYDCHQHSLFPTPNDLGPDQLKQLLSHELHVKDLLGEKHTLQQCGTGLSKNFLLVDTQTNIVPSSRVMLFDVFLQIINLLCHIFDPTSDGGIIPFSGASKLEAGIITPTGTPSRWPPSRVCSYSIPYFIFSAPPIRGGPLLLSFRLAA